MARQISVRTRAELLRQLRERYAVSTKIEKCHILNEFAIFAGCHRKRAIRLLKACVEKAWAARGRSSRL